MAEFENHTVPVETQESWRAWLMTGARRTPVDRRRMRGGHKGLKKILLEGLAGNGAQQWQDFSGAMVRHAVEDAMRSLPPEQTRVIKLAYFGGYSNREIAREVGMTRGTVQRLLRRALTAISDHIQGGEALGRRAVYGLGLFLSGRWLTQHAWTATVAATAAVVIVAAHPLPVTQHQSPAPVSRPAARAGQVAAPAHVPAAAVHVQLPTTSPPVKLPSVEAPTVQVPTVKLPLPVPTPSRLKNLL